MANNQDHVWTILRDVLEFLAGAGIPTPERGYALDGGWSLALSDLRRLVADRNALRVQVKTVIAERDALRAELAAAKNLLARIHRDGGHHTQAVGFTQSVADAVEKVSEWLLAADERTALAADNARLMAALENIRGPLIVPDADGLIEDATCAYCETSSIEGCDEDCPREIAAEALAATPAQSLAAHDAALLRKVAKQMDPDGGCYEAKLAEADRIERAGGTKGAGRG